MSKAVLLNTVVCQDVVSVERFEVVQCSWCNRYFDAGTREEVEPQDVVSHTICRACLNKELGILRQSERR